MHRERPFFGELVDFMISGPVVVQVLEGENAIAKYRDVMGATDPAKAAAGTIRKVHAKSIGENSVHGSDAPETARHGNRAVLFRERNRRLRPGCDRSPLASHPHSTLDWVDARPDNASGRGAAGQRRADRLRGGIGGLPDSRFDARAVLGGRRSDHARQHHPVGRQRRRHRDGLHDAAAEAAVVGHDPRRRRRGAAARDLHRHRRARDGTIPTSSWSAARCCSTWRSSSSPRTPTATERASRVRRTCGARCASSPSPTSS